MSKKIQTKNHIAYSKQQNTYYVYVDGKRYSYGIKRYGKKFSLKLCELSLVKKRRYNDYFEEQEDGTTKFFIYTQKWGIKIVIVDTEDAKIFYDCKISIKQSGNTFYASTKYGKMHRMIMNPKSSKEIIDHIDRNGLNNSKKNLRIVDVSINNRNTKIRKDNTSGRKGVCEDQNRFRVFWYNDKKQKLSKSFSKRKFGIQKAYKLAVSFREKVEKENSYIV